MYTGRARRSLRAAVLMLVASGASHCHGEDAEGGSPPRTTKLEHGFRRDPMGWVENDGTLEGAIVRKLVFGKPKAGDQALIDEAIGKVLAKQNEDGSFGENAGETGRRVRRLLNLGCSAGRSEVRRALEAIRRLVANAEDGDEHNAVMAVPLPVLRVLGMASRPEVGAGLAKRVEELPGLLGSGCPSTPYNQIRELWEARDLADVDAAVVKGLTWVRDHLIPCVCSRELGLTNPWAVVSMTGRIDHPIAREIARKLVPMILRGQREDGGWANHSRAAFLALKTHRLLGELRELPPLPPDWKIVRSIPAPGERPFNLARDAERLWVHDWGAQTAFAVSPRDGAIVREVKLPKKPGCAAFGVWDGSLWLLLGRPGDKQKSLLRLDANTGQVQQQIPLPFHVRHFAAMVKVGDRVLISDQFEGFVWSVDLTNPADHHTVRLGAGMPDFIGNHGDDLWCIEGGGWRGVFLVRTKLDGTILDWGEQPVGWAGVAWDGRTLWALDRKSRRVCVVEKTKSGKEAGAALDARR